MYAEQIEAERNGTWSTTYFTDTFTDLHSSKYICPKADTIEVDDVNFNF